MPSFIWLYVTDRHLGCFWPLAIQTALQVDRHLLTTLQLCKYKAGWIHLTGSKNVLGTSLVAQWVRICLRVPGTRAWPLVWEAPNYLVVQTVKRPPAMRETWVRSLGREDLPEKEMATHSSPLAWKMLWTVEPGRLQSMGHKESDMTEQLHFHFHWEAPKCLRTTKPKRRNYRSPPARELCSTRREATAMRSWSTETRVQPPLSATRESPHTATKTQGSQK